MVAYFVQAPVGSFTRRGTHDLSCVVSRARCRFTGLVIVTCFPKKGTRPYIWIYSQLLRRDGRNGETVRHTSTVVAVPSQADTQLSPMGVAWSTTALIACSIRIRSQDSPPRHGLIVPRCPGTGREAPMVKKRERVTGLRRNRTHAVRGSTVWSAPIACAGS